MGRVKQGTETIFGFGATPQAAASMATEGLGGWLESEGRYQQIVLVSHNVVYNPDALRFSDKFIATVLFVWRTDENDLPI